VDEMIGGGHYCSKCGKYVNLVPGCDCESPFKKSNENPFTGEPTMTDKLKACLECGGNKITGVWCHTCRATILPPDPTYHELQAELESLKAEREAVKRGMHQYFNNNECEYCVCGIIGCHNGGCGESNYNYFKNLGEG